MLEMFNLKGISSNLAKNLSEELKFNQEKYEVVEYGLHAFFHALLSVILVIIFGAAFGVLLESLIISFTVSILRRSSGGAHASTELSCASIGVVGTVIPAIILASCNINTTYTIIMSILIFIVSIYLNYKLAPVDSPNKPIRSEKKIKRLKKGSLITLVIYMIIITLNIFFSVKLNNLSFLVYSLCIAIGTLWQSFTLTKLGHIVFKLMDSFFIFILFRKGRKQYEKN